jgi:glycosyltransferase involved in cell wall biosynthesis
VLEHKILVRKIVLRKPISVLIVGRNDPYKGGELVKEFIRHTEMFPEKYSHVMFTVVGLTRFRSSRVIFKDELRYEDVVKEYTLASIFINPSYLENSPNVLFEAVAFGCIPLSSDSGDAKQIILNDALLFESGNVADLISKFDTLIENYSAFARKMPLLVRKLNQFSAPKALVIE